MYENLSTILRNFSILVILFALLSCADTTKPESILHWYHAPGLEQFQPDEFHKKHYNNMLACVGPVDTVVAFDDITWYRAHELRSRSTGRVKAGLAMQSTNTIYLASQWERSYLIVPHEILHLLLPHAVHGTPEFAECDPMQGYYSEFY